MDYCALATFRNEGVPASSPCYTWLFAHQHITQWWFSDAWPGHAFSSINPMVDALVHSRHSEMECLRLRQTDKVNPTGLMHWSAQDILGWNAMIFRQSDKVCDPVQTSFSDFYDTIPLKIWCVSCWLWTFQAYFCVVRPTCAQAGTCHELGLLNLGHGPGYRPLVCVQCCAAKLELRAVYRVVLVRWELRCTDASMQPITMGVFACSFQVCWY